MCLDIACGRFELEKNQMEEKKTLNHEYLSHVFAMSKKVTVCLGWLFSSYPFFLFQRPKQQYTLFSTTFFLIIK